MAKTITLTSFKELSEYVAAADTFASAAEKYAELKKVEPQHWMLDFAQLNKRGEFEPTDAYFSFYGRGSDAPRKFTSDLEKALMNWKVDTANESDVRRSRKMQFRTH